MRKNGGAGGVRSALLYNYSYNKVELGGSV